MSYAVLWAILASLFACFSIHPAWAGERPRDAAKKAVAKHAKTLDRTAPEEPKYLLFWWTPERVPDLIKRVGTKGDGRTHILGFGLPNSTFELEKQLPERIRSVFEAARKNDVAVMLNFDMHQMWESRPDLWNWFDPEKPGYNPENKYNVEWHGWDGPPNKVSYLNWGIGQKMPPHICFTSKKVRAELRRLVTEVIGPVVTEEVKKLEQDGKGNLFVGILVGAEPKIDNYTNAWPGCEEMMKEDGTPMTPLGYRALLDRGYSAENPPKDFHKALAEVIQESVSYWCKLFVEAGIPPSKLYPHIPGAHEEITNTPLWAAFNEYSRPAWSTYAESTLVAGFEPIYEELKAHGNPPWAGTEANAGFPGSIVDWETYLGWHYNHGAVYVGINKGATGDLEARLEQSAFSEEALAAYRKFFEGKTLEEKPISKDQPAFRAPEKMQRVQATMKQWREQGRDPSAVQELLKGVEPLAVGGKMAELEQLLDRALEMLK